MKIKNGFLLDPNFIPAFEYLQKKELTAKQCIEMNQIAEELSVQFRVLQKSKYQLMEQYSAKDENKKMRTEENGDVIFPDSVTKVKCQKEIIDLMNEEYDVPLTTKIKVYEDETMTPVYYNLIKDLVDIVPRPKI